MKKAPLSARALRRRITAFWAASVLSAAAGTYTNDFSGGTGGLTIYTIAGAAPEVRATGGNPDAYLKLTDAVNTTTSTVIFPDLDGGRPVQSFVFEVDCRIGNGSDVPADGFSISFARRGDDALDDGEGFIGAAEDGTKTGLAIGFDCYDNDAEGTDDIVGFSVNVDGVPIVADVPAPVLNGALDNPLSLQTGPVGEAGWAKFRVELKSDGKLDVVWKGTKMVDNAQIDWTPSSGRMVFAARTGGLNQVHHFDNISITTVPAPIAAVTSATVNSTGYTFLITDAAPDSVVTEAGIESLTIDGAEVTPTSVTKTGEVTTVTYVPATPVANRSEHTYELVFKDQTTERTDEGTILSPFLPAAPLLAAAPVAGVWNVREVKDGAIEPFEISRAATMFAEAVNITDATSPYINFRDPETNGESGLFSQDASFLTNTDAADDNIIQGSNILITIAGTTPAELQRTFWVQSDDGFALRVRPAAAAGAPAVFINKTGPGLIDFNDPSTFGLSGVSNTRAVCQFPVAGDYIVEFLYYEGGGGAFNEVAWALKPGDFANNILDTPWALVGGGTEAPVLPAPLPATADTAPAGQWDMREIRNSGYETGDGGATLANAVAAAAGDVSGFAVTDAVAQVVNHTDPDERGLTSGGFFRNDLPFIGNLDGPDNNVIVVARTTVTFAQGQYTIGVTADDGWALTVPGAWFSTKAGTGSLDRKDSATLFNPVFTEAPGLGVLTVPAAGDYEVFFLAQEGVGGAAWEVFYAPGSFTTIGGTSEWKLIGNPAAVPPVPLLPATLPGPEGQEGLWGIRFVRSGPAGQGDNIFNAINSIIADGGAKTDGTTPILNYNDLDDPDPAALTEAGLFQTASTVTEYQVADLEFAGSTGVDDQLIAIAKARIVIPAGEGGEWTFGVHSDDGFALRIDGAAFKRVSGDSFIDNASLDTVYFRFGTGDSNARAVTDLTEGEHDVEFIWFEGGGGANFELYAAKGGFNNDADTTAWRLVGGEGGLALAAQATTTPAGDFVITSVTAGPGAGEVTITFPSVQGTAYTVEWSTDLTAAGQPGGWQTATTVNGGAGATTSATVNAATLNGGTAPQRLFLRVKR